MGKINYEVFKPLLYTKELKESYMTATVTSGTIFGKTVLVTGATGGIGAAIAERYLKEGCTIILAGRNEKKLRDIKINLGEQYHNKNIFSIVIDLMDKECGEKITQALYQQNLNVDILINNAGVFLPTDRKRNFRGVTREQFFQVWNTNYAGTKKTSYAVANHMRKNKTCGSIVNISSICAFSRNYQYTSYGMSKTAVLQLTTDLRRDYPEIRIFSIAPGSVATRMGDLQIGSNIAKKTGVLNRVALPEEIAAIIAFMTSDTGREISKCTITTCGCETL